MVKSSAIADANARFAHSSTCAAINRNTTMTTLVLERLAKNDKEIAFTHALPGLIAGDDYSRLAAPDSYGLLERRLLAFISRLASIVQLLFGASVADCGLRQANLLTSDKYGPRQVWRITQKSNPVTPSGVLQQYRQRGWQERIWDYTLGVFEKALATGK